MRQTQEDAHIAKVLSASAQMAVPSNTVSHGGRGLHGRQLAGAAWQAAGRGCVAGSWQGLRGRQLAGAAWQAAGRGCMQAAESATEVTERL